MAEGYIYVLANSAMPGVVKVGKTTRTPTDRASELSSSSGVPIPFIVVYEEFVYDCHQAEKNIHEAMSERGYRYADNREFFTAPVSEIIHLIEELKVDVGVFGENDPSWKRTWEEAEASYCDRTKSEERRLQTIGLYEKAAGEGCLNAFTKLADIYAGEQYIEHSDAFIPKNDALRRKYLEEGVEAGNYLCHFYLTYWMALNEQQDVANEHISLAFEQRENQGNEELESDLPFILRAKVIRIAEMNWLILNERALTSLLDHRLEMVAMFNNRIHSSGEDKGYLHEDILVNVVNWLRTL